MEIKLARSKYLKVYHLRITGRNSKIVFTSESYFTKGNAIRAGRIAARKLNLKFKETI